MSSNPNILRVNIQNIASVGVYTIRIVAFTQGKFNQFSFQLTISCTIRALNVGNSNVRDVLYVIQSDLSAASVKQMPVPTYLVTPAYCPDQSYSLKLIQDSFYLIQNQEVQSDEPKDLQPYFIYLQEQLINISSSDMSLQDRTFSFHIRATSNANLSIQNSEVSFKVTFKCGITGLKPVYTDKTTFKANYELRGPSMTLIMPQYIWTPQNCTCSLTYELINLTTDWNEHLFPKFFKPNLALGLVLLDGFLHQESDKLFSFRLIAWNDKIRNDEYEFMIQTSFLNSAPYFTSPLANQIVLIGLNYAWTLPPLNDKEGDFITSIQVKLGVNNHWLRFESQSMSFKAIGVNTLKMKEGTSNVKIIIQDQFGAEATYNQGIFLDSRLASNFTSNFNQTSNSTFPNDTAACNATSNSSVRYCNESSGNQSFVQNQTIDQPYNGGYFVVPQGTSIKDQSSFDGALPLVTQAPKKLEITLRTFDFGCGLEIIFSEPIDTGQPDFQKNLNEMFAVKVFFKNLKQNRRELKVRFKAGNINSQTNSNRQNLASYRQFQVQPSVDKGGQIIRYQVQFDDPLDISMGENIHYLGLVSSNLTQLRGKDSPLMIPNVQPTTFQLPSQIKTEDVKSTQNVTKTAQNAARKTIIVSLLLSFLMGSSLNLVWSMVGSLQNIALMAFMNVSYPGNANSCIQRIFWISSFELIPTQIIDWYSGLWLKPSKLPIEDETMNELFSQRFFQMGVTNRNPMFNLSFSGFLILLLAAQIFTVMTLPFLLQKCNNKCSAKVLAFCEGQKKKLLWNTTLRLFIEVYFDIVISRLVRIKTNEWNDSYERFMTFISWIMICFCATFPILLFAIIWRHREDIESDDFNVKFGELVDMINLSKPKAAYFWCLYVIQRLIESLIIVQLQKFQALQVALYMLYTIMFMIYVGLCWPFQEKLSNIIELLNCISTLFACYFLIFFTDFLPNNKIRYESAWGLISLISMILVVNIAVQIKLIYKEVLQSLKKKYIRLRNCLRKKQAEKTNQLKTVIPEEKSAEESENEQQGTQRDLLQDNRLLTLPSAYKLQLDEIVEIERQLNDISEVRSQLEESNDQPIQPFVDNLPDIGLLPQIEDEETIRAQTREKASQIVEIVSNNQYADLQTVVKEVEEATNISEDTKPSRLVNVLNKISGQSRRRKKPVVQEFTSYDFGFREGHKDGQK